MAELVIQGLTLEQYAQYNADALYLTRKWEQSEGKLDIKNDMLAVLKKHKQDPALCMEGGKLNYHACGLIYEWHEAIDKDADLMVKFSQLSGQAIQRQMFGDTSKNAAVAVEGVSLDTYAKGCALISTAQESEVPGILAGIGVANLDVWKKAQSGFTKMMEDPANMPITMEYGQLYMKYAPQHAQNVQQYSVDSTQEIMDQQEEKEELQNTAIKQVMKMAASGSSAGILDYLKKTFPKDAEEDPESLDWYLDKACDLFQESGNKDGAKVVLEVRYEFTDKDEPKNEWIENELDNLFH